MAEVPRLGLSHYALLGSRDEDVTGTLGRALRDRPFRRLGRILLLEVSCYGRRVVSHRGFMAPFGDGRELCPAVTAAVSAKDPGAMVAQVVLAESPWRVAVIAALSWSYAFMFGKALAAAPVRLAPGSRTKPWRRRTPGDGGSPRSPRSRTAAGPSPIPWRARASWRG